MERAIRLLVQLGIVGTLLTTWQWAADHHHINTFFTGTPLGIANGVWTWAQDGSLAAGLHSTAYVTILGFILGTAGGALLGAAMGLSRVFRAFAEPFVAFFNGLPRLVMQPLFVIVLGYGSAPKVVLVVFVLLFVVAVNVAVAFDQVDVTLLDNLRLLGGNRKEQIRHVFVPSAFGAFISTSRLTVGYALAAAVVAEFVGSSEGLGSLIAIGQGQLNIDAVMAGVAVVAVVAMMADGALSLVEKRATRWTVR